MVRALILRAVAWALVVGFASPCKSQSSLPVVRTSQLDHGTVLISPYLSYFD